ncbi:Grx4 family monothiol glutaredoxin [Peredibacter sp. HCB2-198]|uniref:Grx4 family monothiol glutaredoxin n=1 Tax=Peredibacter sp. HCB2-198 TaxID=3383025 RepID=UPI0038B68A73
MSFNVLNNDIQEIESADKSKDINGQIEGLLNSGKVVLFMKGNSEMPQCGFSANSVAILKHLGVPFKTFNILNDPEIRQGLKEFSNWPTYPQLYVNAKLIGGNDIITEMYKSGELQDYLKNN